MRRLIAGLAASAALFTAGAASAALPVYPTPGTENPVLVTLSALASGDIIAFFAGADAGDTEDIGLLINGVDTGIFGLQNHTSSPGDALNFGHANAGDTLVFFIRDHTTGDTFFSAKSMNADGLNHAFAAPYTGGDFGIPAGVFVAFEDRGPDGDKDYNDETFVFQNVSSRTVGLPEPASWTMMIMGFGAAGAMMRRRRTAIA